MVLELTQGLSPLLALALFHKYTLQFANANRRLSHALTGLLFGSLCVVVMSIPLEVGPGIFFDPRSVILSLAGLFSGLIGSVIAASMAAAYRIWLGGSGMHVGITVIVMCTLAGLAFRYLVHKKIATISATSLLAFGLLVHLFGLAIFMELPPRIADVVMSDLALPILLFFSCGVLILGLLLRDNENTRLLNAELSKNLAVLQHKQNLIDEHAIFSETDKHGRIVAANDLFCSISGYAREELIGRDHRLLNSKHHGRDFFEGMWTEITAGRPWSGVIKNQRKDGSEYWVKSTILPAKNDKGDITGYASIRTDFTEDRLREKEMETARNTALEANAAKSNFIATMSHELRTPLNAIIGFSDMMKQEAFGPLGNDKYREYIDDIRYSAGALKTMVEDILDMAKIDLATYQFSNENFDVVSYSEEIVRRFTPDLQVKKIQPTINVSANFPRTLCGDKKVQLHIFNNLISNAIKFTPQGGTIDIDWSLSDDGKIMCSISDTGSGISPQILEKLGQPFISTDNPHQAKDDKEGVGLGFYISKSLVEARGGHVKVASVLGKGTRVSLIYPSGALLPKEMTSLKHDERRLASL